MSCLFISLSSFISNTTPDLLRQLIVDYLKKDPTLYDNCRVSELLQYEQGVPATLSSYVAHMGSDTAWGGAIEIKAFCDLFKVRVIVHVLSTGQTIEFVPSTGTTPVAFNISWNGSHFEPYFTKR